MLLATQEQGRQSCPLGQRRPGVNWTASPTGQTKVEHGEHAFSVQLQAPCKHVHVLQRLLFVAPSAQTPLHTIVDEIHALLRQVRVLHASPADLVSPSAQIVGDVGQTRLVQLHVPLREQRQVLHCTCTVSPALQTGSGGQLDVSGHCHTPPTQAHGAHPAVLTSPGPHSATAETGRVGL